MANHPLSSIVMGIILIAGGLVLIILGLFGNFDDSWVSLIYGIPALILGIFLLVWKKEDDIEQRKDLVKSKMKGGKKK